ncbi:Nitric oxide reductase transcription regulator NorR2 [compost metagenome]
MLLLAGRFLELNRARLGLRSLRLSPAAQDALRRYRWPGNVRELEHVLSRAALRAVSRGAGRNDIVTLETELLDLDGLDAAAPALAEAARALLPPIVPGTSLREAVDQTQRACIEQALQAHGGNWAQAARQLGVDASNLHKLARRLGCK